MNLVALVLAQVFRLTAPQLAQPMAAVPDASRYHFTEFADALDRGDAFRYHLAEFCAAIDRLDTFRYRLAEFADTVDRVDARRYHLAEFSAAVERDGDRCICMTTRLSPATLKSEVLLVSDCSCRK
jgi:hypothetical protein